MTSRVEEYIVTLLDKNEIPQGRLDGVTGGKITLAANSSVKGSGQLEWNRYSTDTDWSSARIQIKCITSDMGEIPLGVYVVAAPNRDYSGYQYARGIDLTDKLAILQDQILTSTYSILPGMNLVQAATQLILDLGETSIQATPSDVVAVNPRVWHPGTSLIQVINDLMDSVGYWSVWTNRLGSFMLTPWVSPSDRASSWAFSEGQNSLHLPEWQYETSLWEATNRVVLVSQEDENGTVLTSVATNDDPNSPTSTVRMGRVINPIVEEGVEAANQAVLDMLAERKLVDNSNVIEKISIDHLLVPLWYNEAVSFNSSGVQAMATIQRMDITLKPGSLVKTEMRAVSGTINI